MGDFIKEFWDQQAINHKSSHVASWGDNFAIELEIENISKYITKGDVVLDVGCANGYSTFRMLERKPSKIVGVDFSEQMIHFAHEANEGTGDVKPHFEVGDIRTLNFENESFDVVYTTRVLINLPNWAEQVQGMEECLRVCKKGGKVIFSEAFWEPLVLLNSLRALKQLPPLVEHDFNRYLKQSKLNSYLKEKKLKYEVIEFSSIYYLGSRFLRELVTNPSDYPGYTNPINQIFYNVEKDFSGGGFGIQQAYVIEKA